VWSSWQTPTPPTVIPFSSSLSPGKSPYTKLVAPRRRAAAEVSPAFSVVDKLMRYRTPTCPFDGHQAYESSTSPIENSCERSRLMGSHDNRNRSTFYDCQINQMRAWEEGIARYKTREEVIQKLIAALPVCGERCRNRNITISHK
jgi:hypothetical protein